MSFTDLTTTRASYRQWIYREQAVLWDDFASAIDRSRSRVWSMDAADFARRIIAAARLVGPVSHGEVPWPLVGGGVFRRLYALADIDTDVPDARSLPKLGREMDAAGGGGIAEHHARYAATIAAFAEDERERRFILSLDD